MIQLFDGGLVVLGVIAGVNAVLSIRKQYRAAKAMKRILEG